MIQRKLALLIPLLLVLIGIGTEAFAQYQQAYRYLKDFSYLTKDRRNSAEKVEDFIQALKRGDRRSFQTVRYDEVLVPVIVKLKRLADEVLKTKTPEEVGFLKAFLLQMAGDEKRNRATLVQAALPGIFNMDPRVRLVAASWLRTLRPDVTMMRAVKLAVGVDVRVIHYDAATDDFVFTHPRILETVASFAEYYREKDLDYPGVFTPGAIETVFAGSPAGNAKLGIPTRIGGIGTNGNHVANDFNKDANSDNLKNVIVTGLDARRWGAPNVYDENRKWEKQLPRYDAAGAAKKYSGRPPAWVTTSCA